MKTVDQLFESRAREAFSFLESRLDFGVLEVWTTALASSVDYARDDIEISIQLDRRDRLIFVEFEDTSRAGDEAGTRQRIELGEVLATRLPSEFEHRRPLAAPLTTTELEGRLAKLARLVADHCRDLLEGDFELLGAIEDQRKAMEPPPHGQ